RSRGAGGAGRRRERRREGAVPIAQPVRGRTDPGARRGRGRPGGEGDGRRSGRRAAPHGGALRSEAAQRGLGGELVPARLGVALDRAEAEGAEELDEGLVAGEAVVGGGLLAP